MSRSRTLELARTMWRGFSRDRSALFFTVVFPLMFLLVFGGIFSGDSISKTKIYVVGSGAIVDNLPSDVLLPSRTPTLDEGVRRVREGKRAAVVAQIGNRVVVRYAATDPVAAGIVRGVVSAVANEANLRAAGVRPRYALSVAQVEDESLSAIEFYVPGILGWAISVGAVFSVALMLVSWREKGILRQLRLAPVSTGELAAARLLVSIGVALAQTALFFAVGIVLFGLQLSGAWWMAVPLVVAGTLAFLAVGLLVGGFAKTVDAASAIANLVVLPMAFLSGAFFPVDTAPYWLQTLAKLLPLRYLLEGLKDVTVRGLGPAVALPDIAILLGFAVVVGMIATHLFRWSGE